MSRFVDRGVELSTLEEQYRRSESSFIVIYGRRRTGKTALISEFMQGKRGMYYLATEESEEQNLRGFAHDVAKFLGDDALSQVRFDSWAPLFELLSRGANEGERVIIAIDEFQYIGASNKSFPSIMQKIWDETLSKSNVMLIICGSLISMMTTQVLSYDSPLYGRRTAQIRLTQIPFRHYREFFDHPLSERQLMERYSITGGIPKYIETFAGPGSLQRLIERNVLNRSSYLFDEPNFLLSKEATAVGTLFSILRAISFGNHKLSEISSALGTKATNLTKYLGILENLDLLEREVPATEGNPQKSKKGLYVIKDNYVRFWFRFIFPAMGLLERGYSEPVMREIMSSLNDVLCGPVYESVCREHVWELSADGRLGFLPDRVGRWWGARDVEIDVCAPSKATGEIAFGECKFWKSKVGLNVLEDLERKAEQVGWREGSRKVTYLLFSIAGFTKELEGIAAARDDLILVGSLYV